MKLGLNNEDLTEIEKRGLKPEKVARQIDIFKRGNVAVELSEAATLRNGIRSFSEDEKEELIRLYDSKKDKIGILKFVPASGAATRMFKALYKFLAEYDLEKETVEEYVERKNNPKLELFFRRLSDLPFYEEVVQKIVSKKGNFESLSEDEQQFLFVKMMLQEEGKNFGEYPKGLVPFHNYKEFLATAFEEHLREAADYATSNGVVKIHFTVSKEHYSKFKQEYEKIEKRLEQETGLRFDISFSYQDPKTDTIAVDLENEPFREEDGKLLFRPGGHGALIENLNAQDADLIFIKNIDNVVVPKYRQILAENKKILAGKLLQLQEKSFSYLQDIQKGEISEEKLEEIIHFLRKELNCASGIDNAGSSVEEKISVIKKKLNRPIRICGMVKNEGEPGGGPFWVKDENAEDSLQIVESSQIDHDNYQQSKIAQEATHFNPVDVVVGKKNYNGNSFTLMDFVDSKTSFISNKTKNGRELKALEHPGLWNGGMANWISIFVEVPIETFNPVKTVADLLKQTHQVK